MEQHNTQDYSTHARKHTYQGEERQREGDRGRKWTASTCWRFCIIIVIEWVEGWGGQGSYNGCACHWTTRHVVSNFSTWNWPKHITHTYAHSIFGGGGSYAFFCTIFQLALFVFARFLNGFRSFCFGLQYTVYILMRYLCICTVCSLLSAV